MNDSVYFVFLCYSTNVDDSIFVGREAELNHLHGLLDKTLSGQGQICLLSGEAGSGKTALFQAFVRQTQAENQAVLAAAGGCNAAAGFGEPYLPFRELLSMLTGEVQVQRGGGVSGPENTHRLQSFLEVSVETLCELGPDVLELFVPLAALVVRLGMFAAKKSGVGHRLQGLVGGDHRKPAALSPDTLIQQYTRSLQGLAAKRPLLLLVDDLQWSDAASANLFFHLSRQFSGHRILLVGAYRPEETNLGRDRQRHPLEKVLSEVKRYQGDVWVDLN